MAPHDHQPTAEEESSDRLELPNAMRRVLPAGALLLDAASGACIYADSSIERHLGYSPEEVKRGGTPFLLGLMHPEDAGFPRRDSELRLRHRDGRWRWFHLRRSRIHATHHEERRRVLVVFQDITEHRAVEDRITQTSRDIEAWKNVQDRLIRSEALLNEAQSLAGLGSFEMDLRGTESVWSDGMFRLLDRDPWKGPLDFLEFLTLIPPGDREAWALVPKRQRQHGATLRSEFKLNLQEGGTRHLVVLARVVEGLDGFPDKLLGALQDLTDRKKDEEDRKWFQERIHRSEKMEAVGQLAGGVAHDFNNHLAAIMGFAELMKERLEGVAPELCRYASNILTSCRRSSELTQQLLAFARKGKYLTVPVDLQEIIAEVMQILRHSIDRRITLQSCSDGHPAIVLGDPSQIQNALMNLAINARDAMPEGGTLTFATEVRELDEAYCARLPHEMHPGSYMQLSVTDTGVGMEKDLQLRIFEPFFTTKEPGKGTGLGLASVFGTVKSHRGTILVYSELGQGSCFKIFLPLAKGEVKGRDTREVPETHVLDIEPSTKQVMIVEDETMVGQMLSAQLEDYGFRTVLLPDGRAAVEAYRDTWAEIDLVILDMVMPQLSGRDTFHAMKAINPDVRVILSSGYSLLGEAQSIMEQGAVAFLQKPYQAGELARVLVQAFSA
jgi:PAS domain S-box-containing protein